MNTYKGLKSTDAEIILDLEKGKAFFDYSLNKFSWVHASNDSCKLSQCGKKDIKISDILFSIYSPVVAAVLEPIIVHYPKYQYWWQKFLKKMFLNLKGMQIQTSVGKLKDTKTIFYINNNIWFEYEMDGEYKENIKKISLLRHFIIKQKHGVTTHIQNGWDVVFEFKEEPQSGYCVLRSVL